MKILIIKLGALGDMVISTSLVHQIMRHHQQAEFFLLTSNAYREIFASWQNLQLYCMNRHSLHDNIQALRWMRKNNFDRVYDLQSNDRTAILCALSSIKEIIGNHPHFPYSLHPRESYAGQCHIYDRMLDVLRSAGIDARAEPPRLIPSATDITLVREWLLKQHLQDGSFVILHAGASTAHPEKCWPHFAELAQKIAESGYKIIWVGAAEDSERNRQLSAITGIDATGAFSVVALAELGRHAKFAVTNDSGPMHILSASGIPVFAFFGPTNWRRNHAIGQEPFVLAAEDTTSKAFIPATLDNISTGKVIQKLKSNQLI